MSIVFSTVCLQTANKGYEATVGATYKSSLCQHRQYDIAKFYNLSTAIMYHFFSCSPYTGGTDRASNILTHHFWGTSLESDLVQDGVGFWNWVLWIFCDCCTLRSRSLQETTWSSSCSSHPWMQGEQLCRGWGCLLLLHQSKTKRCTYRTCSLLFCKNSSYGAGLLGPHPSYIGCIGEHTQGRGLLFVFLFFAFVVRYTVSWGQRWWPWWWQPCCPSR